MNVTTNFRCKARYPRYTMS